MALRRFLLATTFLTFILLVVGGTVNPTGSSLACPDWPTCFGSFFPEMKDGVEHEHTHRVVATGVGLLTLIFALWCLRTPGLPRGVKSGGLLALFLVILQGVLGGLTVIYKLPTMVSSSHLALSMGFFCLLLFYTFRLYRTPNQESTSASRAALFASIIVYLQILLGALVRHTNSARTCGLDPILCLGEFWPQWGPQRLHMTHRFVAIFAFLISVWASLKTSGQAKKTGNILARRLSLITPYISILQVILGIITVQTNIAVIPVTAHLGVGALMLSGLWCQYLALVSHATDPLKPQSIHTQLSL